mgnify:CR=1 FL=1
MRSLARLLFAPLRGAFVPQACDGLRNAGDLEGYRVFELKPNESYTEANVYRIHLGTVS